MILANAPTHGHGAPRQYDRERCVSAICERLAEGIPLAVICRDLDDDLSFPNGFPHPDTVYLWMKDDASLSQQFARARALGYDAIALKAMRMAETPMKGEIVTVDGDGKTTVKTEDMLGHRRLVVETYLKLLAKWDPKRYGEQQREAANVSVNVGVQVNTEAERLRLHEKRKRALQAPPVVEIDNVTQERSCKVDGPPSVAVETDTPSTD